MHFCRIRILFTIYPADRICICGGHLHTDVVSLSLIGPMTSPGCFGQYKGQTAQARLASNFDENANEEQIWDGDREEREGLGRGFRFIFTT